MVLGEIDVSLHGFRSNHFLSLFSVSPQTSNRAHAAVYSGNSGLGRIIPRQGNDVIRVHRSVKIRIDAGTAVADGKMYVPEAKWDCEPRWED